MYGFDLNNCSHGNPLVVFAKEAGQALRGCLSLPVCRDGLPAHPCVHPSTASLLQAARNAGIKGLGWSLFSAGRYLYKENPVEY